MGLADLKRVTDLFTEGAEIVFDDGEAEGHEPVLLWANKLNAFEAEDARRDGLAARSRVILALKDIGTPEYADYQARSAELSKDELIKTLISEKQNEYLIAAVEELRRDPEWAERVEAMGRISGDMEADERVALEKINGDYAAEMTARMDAKRAQDVVDFGLLRMEELTEKDETGYADRRGFGAFQREYGKSQLFYSIRMCMAAAKHPVTGKWDHTPCAGHRARALDSRDEVTQLDPELLQRLQDAVRDVSIDRRDARFSDALASSSAPSAQPSEVEESTASTPAGTPREPAMTSS